MSTPHDASRRAALKGLAASFGVAVGAPAIGQAAPHPIGEHIVQRPPASIEAPATDAPPEFLDPHQFATLRVIADIIVPGAVASGSPQFIDHVLAIESAGVRQRFVSALGVLESGAREAHRQSFRSLDAEQQAAWLAAASAGSSGPAAQGACDHLKSWIAGAHFSSEAGMQELGWQHQRFFTAFPACPHPEGHA